MNPDIQAVLQETFAQSFMKPIIEETDYWEVEADQGGSIIPADVVGIPARIGFAALGEDELEPFAQFAEGEVFSATLKHGWIARLSAPGYMDSTDWSAFATFDEAAQYLIDTYGDDT